MILKKLFNNKGFSLAEVMVAAGLVGLIGVAGNTILQNMAKSKRKADASLAKNMEMDEIKGILAELKNLSWGYFNFNETYFQDTSSPSKVSWNLSDVSGVNALSEISFEESGTKMYRTSHSVEISGIKTKRMVLFSRCVPRANSDNDLNLSQAYALGKAPWVRFVDNKLKVLCCDRTANKICSNEVVDKNSQYVVRTFFLKGNRLKKYPQDFAEKAIDGIGFMVLFNKTKSPTAFDTILFAQNDRCYSSGETNNCNDPFIMNFVKLGGALKTQAINDSGFLEIR